MVVGGNFIDYPGNMSTSTADLPTSKILFNSVLSKPNTKFMTINIGNFYLNTPMTRFEYMKIHLLDIPQEIIDKYHLESIKDNNSFIYIKIQKGMYGLPQAGILANNLLTQ